MALFGPPRSTFFYPRVSYGVGPVLLDFDDPVHQVVLQITRLAGQNIAEDGTREQLTQRLEHLVTLRFQLLEKTKLDEVWIWYETHAHLGKQSALTLDRFATTSGQFEGSEFNAFFSKAELMNDPFAGLTRLPTRPLYRLELLFRQGT